MEFIARWYLTKNDERAQFEHKDHDPTRYPVESIIDVVPLKSVPETRCFTLDAGTIEVLDMAVKHHGEMNAPVKSTSKKPAARKRARTAKKPAARGETAAKRRRSARASREDEDAEKEQEHQ